MEYQDGPPLPGHAPAGAHSARASRISRRQVTVPGFDPIWFGVFIVVVVEMAQITPPIGFNLFVLQGMTGHPMSYIARAAFPMFLIMMAMVFILIAFPGLATWLPENMRQAR